MPTYKETRAYRGERLSLDSPNLLEYARFELSRSQHIRVRMSGTTMRPTIDDGDLITIEAIDPTTIRPHDIVLYTSSSGTVVVHRVIGFETRAGCTYAIVRGDRSEYFDAPVPLTQVLGRVVTIERQATGRVISLRPVPSLRSRVVEFLKRLFRGR